MSTFILCYAMNMYNRRYALLVTLQCNKTTVIIVGATLRSCPMGGVTADATCK